MGTTTTYRVSGNTVAALRGATTADAPVAQFVRFVLAGGTANLAYLAAFLLLGGYGTQAANVVGAVLSAVLANELHRRLTFHADERVGWLTAQIEAGGVSFIGLVATSAALGWLEATASDAHPFVQIALVATVTALIGLMRFIALRWIFRPRTAERA